MNGLTCADCLCRVCARNECTDNSNPLVSYQDCVGCNGCTGVIDLPENCERDGFVPDEG